MAKARDLERELRALTLEKARAETLNEDLQVRVDRQEENLSRVRNENSNLNHDLNQLINVISSARTTGRWEVRLALFLAHMTTTCSRVAFRITLCPSVLVHCLSCIVNNSSNIIS